MFSPCNKVFPCQYHSTIAPYKSIHHPCCFIFSLTTSVFSCQYHSTNAPLIPPPTIPPVLQFTPVSSIPPLLHIQLTALPQTHKQLTASLHNKILSLYIYNNLLNSSLTRNNRLWITWIRGVYPFWQTAPPIDVAWFAARMCPNHRDIPNHLKYCVILHCT
jgi:hypothetical protein